MHRHRRVSAPADLRLVWSRRLRQVGAALGRDVRPEGSAAPSVRSLEAELSRVVDLSDSGEIWLALAAVSGQLPLDKTVTAVRRAAEFAGARPLLAAIDAATTTAGARRPVEILTDAVVVDVHNTAHTSLATGIQRVARESARRWSQTHACTLVAWIDDFDAMRRLTPVETARMTGQTPPSSEGDSDGLETLVVPWRSTYVLPELVADRRRNQRLLALARHTGNRTGVIGFDCIPMTSGDTSDVGVPDFFADHLATVRHFDRLTAISRAAASEYGGWRTMLGGIGATGPEIAPIILPAEAPEVDEETLARAARRFAVAGLPMVLCVGTHEPRKNHGAVLHAAETLWREGLRFSLTFVGGHSWRERSFARNLAELQAAGRPVETASGVDDSMLWAAYRLARCTIFPSFNEGYGLPVAESLAAGTPAITSNFGSMLEIAADGGALLVDPRDDNSVTDALRELLTDDTTLERLHKEALARPSRTWDDYARDTWEYLVD